MGIDAQDGSARQASADRHTEPQSAERPARAETPLPPTADRLEAQWQARHAADRAYAEQIGDQISKGHAFDKHVIEQREFPEIETRGQFAHLIKDAVMNGEFRGLSGSRTAYWNEGTVVIRDPNAADGGTALRPRDGHDYFEGLH